MDGDIAPLDLSAAPSADVAPPTAEPRPDQLGSAERAAAPVGIQMPDFSPLRDSGKGPDDTSLRRFYDVNVTVSAELGRVTMPIKDLLQLGQGSVVELNRPVTGPIDLVANGVRIARGEVVVVDDCFAVHIKQIEPQGKRAG
jgi:flagellar motor switch protein FliN/FliY